MNTSHTPQNSVLSNVVIVLMKGVIYREDSAHWTQLLNLQAAVRDYISVMHMELMIDEAEGYAYLKSREESDDEEESTRRLVARRPLTFQVSLLLALLRKRLAEFDAQGDEARMVLTAQEIVDMMSVMLPALHNEAKTTDQIHSYIKKVVELGFLKKLKSEKGALHEGDRYEVRRILKAFIDAQWLGDFDAKLATYLPDTEPSDASPTHDEDKDERA